MDDSDEYGDEFDDTEFLNAATQAEKENTPAFPPSPPPAKRQRVGTSTKTTTARQTAPVSRNAKTTTRKGPFVSSDEDEDEEAHHPLSDSGSDNLSPPQKTVPSRHRKKARSRSCETVVSETEYVSPAKDTRANKRQERIHIPTANMDMTDVFFTQPPQEHSPPWKPRGAIWAKQPTTIGLHSNRQVV